MKIVQLTSVHPHTDVRIFTKECISLASYGLDVVLVVPGTKDHIESGVRILGVPKLTSRLGRMIITTFRVYRRAYGERGDIYHFHDPELIPIGILLRLLGCKVIYDVHEDLPRQLMIKPWIPWWLRKSLSVLIEWIEYLSAYFFNGIAAATPVIAARFQKHKTVIIQNFPEKYSFISVNETPYSDRRPDFVYIGGITSARGIHEMIEGISLAKMQESKLVLAGLFESDLLRNEVLSGEAGEYIEYLGWQNRDAVISLLGRVKVGLVLLHPSENYQNAYPVKMFEYMAAGLPIIASNFPLWHKIISQSGCGIVVDPLNTHAIAAAMRWMIENCEEAQMMGTRGKLAIDTMFNWETESKKLIALYRMVSQGVLV